MLSLIAFTVLAQQQQPLFDRVFPHPTGNNALEDYVQAADLLSAGHFGIYQSWEPPETRPTPEELRKQREEERKDLETMDPETRKQFADLGAEPTAEEAQLTDHLNALTFLNVKQEEVQALNGALDLLASGNRKPIRFSGDAADPERSFPLLAAIKQVAKFDSDAALIAFSEGRPEQAVSILDEGLVMSHRIGSGSTIAQLVGIASTAIVLSRFNLHLDCLSLDETREIEKLSGQLLDDLDVYRQMARNEAQSMLSEVARDSEKTPASAPKGESALFTPAQIAEMKQALPQALEARLASAGTLFLRPEDDWLAASEAASDVEAQPKNPSAQQVVDAAASFMASLTIGRQEVLAILKSRAQLRLLRLHALIHEFRWLSGSYPDSLQAMKLPREDTYDPLSQKSFRYEIKDGAYRLYSLGVKETGPIELKYRRSARGADQSDGPISP